METVVLILDDATPGRERLEVFARPLARHPRRPRLRRLRGLRGHRGRPAAGNYVAG